MEVITNVPGKPGGFWHAHTRLIGPTAPHPVLARLIGSRWATRVKDLAVALRLFCLRGEDRGFVTGGGLDGLTFAMLQTLFAWRRCPHVMVDCNWYESATPMGRWLRRQVMGLAARSVQQFVVWATHELDDYARAFGLPPAKLGYVPFHTTLDFYQFEICDDGYLFAGGNYDRDYPTLIEAVRDLDVPVWIATTRPEQLRSTQIPEHVRVAGTTTAGFREALAAARMVVVPMQPGLLHSGGQQTCLNAMFLGKPTIAVGRRWAVDLMDDGVHGRIVDYGDVAGLRAAIQWVLHNPEEARQMALCGQEHAQQFSTRQCMETIYQLVQEATNEEAIASAHASNAIHVIQGKIKADDGVPDHAVREAS
jgi:glycosyltransferase involved in cell wall biosynthesis